MTTDTQEGSEETGDPSSATHAADIAIDATDLTLPSLFSLIKSEASVDLTGVIPLEAVKAEVNSATAAVREIPRHHNQENLELNRAAVDAGDADQAQDGWR